MPYRFKVGEQVKVKKAPHDYTYNHHNYQTEVGTIEKRKWAHTQSYGFQDRYLVSLSNRGFRRWFLGYGLDLNMTENDILKGML